jgi:hypothetical protein
MFRGSKLQLSLINKVIWVLRVNPVKIGSGAKSAKGVNLEGLFVIVFYRGQNRKIMILRGPKLQLSLHLIT